MMNNIVYFTFMKSRGWLEIDDGEERSIGVIMGKENPPLIEEGSLFLGMWSHWDQFVVQDHLTVF